MANDIVVDDTPDDLRWHLLQKKVHEDKIKRAFALFRSHNIEPVLIKGWAAALSYPTNELRPYNDTDLAVDPKEFDKAAEVCDHKESTGLIIDLHKGLRHLDTLPWNDLFENSRLIEIDGTLVRILRPEDHLRVLCIHWLNDGGADRRRLWDVYHAVKNRPPDFDWHRCLATLPENRRRWIVTVIGIAHHYLGLAIDDLPFAEEAADLPRWITRCLESEWRSGIRLEPLVVHFRSPSMFIKQVIKRIPPNPLRAVVEMEGRIDAATRIHYQIGCLARMFTHPLGPQTSNILRGRRGRG